MISQIQAVALLLLFFQPSTAYEEASVDEAKNPLPFPYEDSRYYWNSEGSQYSYEDHVSNGGMAFEYDQSVSQDSIQDNYKAFSTPDGYQEDPEMYSYSADSPYNVEGSEIGESAFIVPDDQKDAVKPPNFEPPKKSYATTVKDGQVDLKDIRKDDGEYIISYTAKDGTKRKEVGKLVVAPNGQKVLVVRGSYVFTAPEGQKFRVEYEADKDGYRIINRKPLGNTQQSSGGRPTTGGKPGQPQQPSSIRPTAGGKPVQPQPSSGIRPTTGAKPVQPQPSSGIKPTIGGKPGQPQQSSGIKPTVGGKPLQRPEAEKNPENLSVQNTSKPPFGIKPESSGASSPDLVKPETNFAKPGQVATRPDAGKRPGNQAGQKRPGFGKPGRRPVKPTFEIPTGERPRPSESGSIPVRGKPVGSKPINNIKQSSSSPDLSNSSVNKRPLDMKNRKNRKRTNSQRLPLEFKYPTQNSVSNGQFVIDHHPVLWRQL